MLSTAFYQNHLDGVSRSFAFCIAQLTEPMRPWVSLSYLICRMLDTVEDAMWADPTCRCAAFNSFDALLSQPEPARAARWAASFPASLTAAEQALLADAGALFAELESLAPVPRQIIRHVVQTMSGGMQHYAKQRDVAGTLRLRNLTEVNRYCYFVAGTVGFLLTKLFVLVQPDLQQRLPLINAGHFGLFLQKINLLKDQRGDEAEGRFLVPDRPRVLASLHDNFTGAMHYLNDLPIQARDYRVFCAWALSLGVHSLPYIEAAYASGGRDKISRTETATVLENVLAKIDDNAALYDGLRKAMPPAHVEGHGNPPPDWFLGLSGDVLQASDMARLRVI